jgi:Flp pilus assembly protein TadG
MLMRGSSRVRWIGGSADATQKLCSRALARVKDVGGAFVRARRGATIVLFAAGAFPMVALAGLAVDYGIWNQANSGLTLAANMAALTAVKIAANAQLANDSNWKAEGEAAGRQWFEGQVGSWTETIVGTTPVTIIMNGPHAGLLVTVTWDSTNASMTASVNYAGTVGSVFGALFGMNDYGVRGGATAVVGVAPFVDVEILLDNSASMEIGATEADIATLQKLTPCGLVRPGTISPGAVYPGASQNRNASDQNYATYQYGGYDGSLTVPFPAGAPLTFAAYDEIPGDGNGNVPNLLGPKCKGELPPDENGNYPTAGPPCAFACHTDTSAPAGEGNDYYALARSTIGKSNQITLRFDLVKAAVNQVIGAMKADNISNMSNLNVGVFTFQNALTQIYPTPGCQPGTLACAAGHDWATAESAVGAPPTVANGPDTGIQPYGGSDSGGDTDFHDSMATLLTYMSPAGNGTSAVAPRKVLFIVSDGLVDYENGATRVTGGVSAEDCAQFKNLGFTIYVVYTPYYPVMNYYYLDTIKPFTEPMATSTVATSLQACASAPGDYVSASDGPTLDAALQLFLRSAIQAPARFTS